MANRFVFDDETQAPPATTVTPTDRFQFESDVPQVPLLVQPQETINPPQPEQSFLDQVLSREALKPASVAAGALVGSELGSPLGPLGILGGGVLGAALGRAGFGAATQEPIKPLIGGILDEVEMEALYGGGFLAIGPALKMLGPQVGKIFGVGSVESKDIARLAEESNVPFGLVEASKSRIIQSFPKVLGVFPFVSAPVRRLQAKKGEALLRHRDDILNQVAPNITLSKLGIDVTKAARRSNSQFRTLSSVLYDNYFRVAKELGNPAVINTSYIKKAAASNDRVPIKLKGEAGELQRPIVSEQVENYIRQLDNLPDFISPAQLRILQQDLNKIIFNKKLLNPDMREIYKIKDGLETAMNNMDLSQISEEAALSLRNALSTANSFHAAGMKVFSSPIAKKFERIDKNIFKTGPFKSGSITPDQIGEVLVKTKDPESLATLREMIGQKEFNKISRAILNRASNRAITKPNAITGESFDFNKFEKALGLDTEDGVETLGELLKNTGVDIKKFRDIIKLGKVHGAVELSDAATFIKRRLILEGLRGAGALAGLTASLANPGTLLISIPALIITRKAGKMLADPKVLRWMTSAMDDTKPLQLRRIAAAQLAIAFMREEDKDKRQNIENNINEIGKGLKGSAL